MYGLYNLHKILNVCIKIYLNSLQLFKLKQFITLRFKIKNKLLINSLL